MQGVAGEGQHAKPRAAAVQVDVVIRGPDPPGDGVRHLFGDGSVRAPGHVRARSRPSSAVRRPSRNAGSLTTGISVTPPRRTCPAQTADQPADGGHRFELVPMHAAGDQHVRARLAALDFFPRKLPPCCACLLLTQCPSPCRPAAVNGQILPGHVAAGIAGQKDDRAFELVRLAHALHGTLGAKPLDHFRGALSIGNGPGLRQFTRTPSRAQ